MSTIARSSPLDPGAGPQPDASLRRRRRPAKVTASLLAAVATLLVGYLAITVGQANAAGPLLSQGKPTTSSSNENASLGPANATDGNTGTRWSSAFSDPQWIQV